ncbi:DinB family protein [Cellulomonas pakistanensis]|nr:DinB family protein [Cellulomonas pakistanensis]
MDGTLERARPADDAPERELLTGMLDHLRGSVVAKVAGLDDEQALRRSVPASALTAAGLVKHLTGVERYWFSIDFAGLPLDPPWGDDAPGAFVPGPEESLASLVAGYEAECARSAEVAAGAALDDRARADDCAFTLRYALVHLIQETARHCGHLDLLRESIDGQTGE